MREKTGGETDEGDLGVAGTHLILDIKNATGLDELDRVERALKAAATAAGATMLHLHTHRFSPQGVSGVALLAESHITVHTWPELGYGAFDAFMCGDTEPKEVAKVLADAFETTDIEVRTIFRGEGLGAPA